MHKVEGPLSRVDIVDPATRSAMMSTIRGKNTKPELVVRRALHATGVRYRVHDASVPGRPDISHKDRRVAVFIDGCFWHGCPRHYQAPASHVGFWKDKLAANQRRREGVKQELDAGGWSIIEVWECEIREDPEAVVRRLEDAFRRV